MSFTSLESAKRVRKLDVNVMSLEVRLFKVGRRYANFFSNSRGSFGAVAWV